jgi:hypothetical protein
LPTKHAEIVTNYLKLQIKVYNLYKSALNDSAATIAKTLAIDHKESL